MSVDWHTVGLIAAGMAVTALCLWLLDKAAIPWLGRRRAARLLKQKDMNGERAHQTPECSIYFDTTGASVRSLTREATECKLSWADVERVAVFKRDLLTTDLICVVLSDRDGNGLEVDEEMGGWIEFAEAIPTYLPGCIPFSKWVWGTAMPPFATNLSEIYARRPQKDSHPCESVVND